MEKLVDIIEKPSQIFEFDKYKDLEICKVPCGHIFHTECLIDGWFESSKKKKCPMCR